MITSVPGVFNVPIISREDQQKALAYPPKSKKSMDDTSMNDESSEKV